MLWYSNGTDNNPYAALRKNYANCRLTKQSPDASYSLQSTSNSCTAMLDNSESRFDYDLKQCNFYEHNVCNVSRYCSSIWHLRHHCGTEQLMEQLIPTDKRRDVTVVTRRTSQMKTIVRRLGCHPHFLAFSSCAFFVSSSSLSQMMNFAVLLSSLHTISPRSQRSPLDSPQSLASQHHH